MKKTRLSKEIDFELKQNADLLENKLSEMQNGCIESYSVESAYALGIKHAIQSMCCELKNFTDIIDPPKSKQIYQYKKKWGIEEWNLDKENSELSQEKAETTNLIGYIQKLKKEYQSSKSGCFNKPTHALEKLDILQRFFENLNEIISILSKD